MINIRRHKNKDEVLNIIKNPVLFNCTYGQAGDKIDLDNKDFIVLEKDNEIIGCFEIKDLTNVCIEAHIFILPKYWPFSLEAVKAGENWAKEQNYKSIVTYIPKNCVHMLKFILRIGYIASGTIPQGIIYKRQLVDLFIFSKTL